MRPRLHRALRLLRILFVTRINPFQKDTHTMPNVNDIFPSKYLKAHDLQGRAWTLTIVRVEFEVMGRTRETLPVVYFKSKAKGLKLNKTNATAITQAAGSALTEDWVGVVVTIYATVADFGGQAYDVVRIRSAAQVGAPQPRPEARPEARPLPPPADELEIDLYDEEIPF